MQQKNNKKTEVKGVLPTAEGNQPAGEFPDKAEPPTASEQTPAIAPESLDAREEMPAPTPDEIAELRAQAALAKEHWDRLLRTTADFENFKKRVARERHEASKYASESLVKKLIPALDNLDMALTATTNTQDKAVQSLQAGITMICQQLKSALAEAGLEEIDAAGKPFDHNWHEAVSEQETADAPEGQVVQQLRKGYKLHDRLLRPASVVVAKRPKA